MKKTIIFFAAAAVALVACNKTEFTGPEAEGEQPVSFRIAVNNLTKASAPFTGTGINTSEYIPIVSSSHYSDGTTIAAKTSFEYLRYLGEYWYLADASFSTAGAFPLGDTRMDVLAFLGYNNNYDPDFIGQGQPYHFEASPGGLQGEYLTAYTDGWNILSRAGWCPDLTDNTNYANKAYFINVATPQYNYDIMYGSANEIKKGEKRTLTLKHAMAALYFNIAFADAIPDGVAMDPLLFIKPGNPGDDFYKALVHCDVNYTPSYNHISGLNSYLSGNYYYNYLSLKTVGTFIVDNSKNNLEASWYLGNWNHLSTNWNTYYNGNGEGYAYLQNGDISEAINTVSSSNPLNLDFNTSLTSSSLSPNTYYRAGAQLVPEQEIVNPWLRYRIGNQIYLTEVNLPHGTWKMGHAYIYNLKLNFNGAKFTVEVEPYEYLTGGHYLEY